MNDEKTIFFGINFCRLSKTAAFCRIYFCVLGPNLQKINSALTYSAIINSLKERFVYILDLLVIL